MAEEWFKLERFAHFVANHAEEIPMCLPLLKGAYRALARAERNIKLLKQCFVEYDQENRKKSSRSSVASTEDCDGDSTVASTSSVTGYRTEAEDEEPTRKKRRKKASLGEGSDNDINAASHQPNSGQSNAGSGHSSPIPTSKKKKNRKKKILDEPCELEIQSTSTITESFSYVESEELKLEMDDDEKIDIIINSVTSESYLPTQGGVQLGLASSEAPTEALVSSTASSASPRKGRRPVCDSESSESVIPSSSWQLGLNGTQVPSLIDHKGTSDTMSCKSEAVSYHHRSVEPSAFNQTGSLALRVIPSALLMESPEQLDAQPVETPLDAQPLEARITPHSSGLQADAGLPHDNDAVKSGDCNMKPNVLYFEFNRDVDRKKWLNQTDLIAAIKKDVMLRGCWITVDKMKRVSDLITGYLIFPDVRSCFIAHRNGLVVNGFRARCVITTVGYYESFADATPHPEPLGFEGPSTAERWLTRTLRPSEPALIETQQPQGECRSSRSPHRGRGVTRRRRSTRLTR